MKFLRGFPNTARTWEQYLFILDLSHGLLWMFWCNASSHLWVLARHLYPPPLPTSYTVIFEAFELIPLRRSSFGKCVCFWRTLLYGAQWMERAGSDLLQDILLLTFIICLPAVIGDWWPRWSFQASVLVHTLNSLAGFKAYTLSIYLKVAEKLSSLRE